MNNTAVHNQDFDTTINNIIQQHNELPLATSANDTNAADNGNGMSIPDNSSTSPILVGEFVNALELKSEIIEDYDDDVIFTSETTHTVAETNGNMKNEKRSRSPAASDAEPTVVNAADLNTNLNDDDDVLLTPEIKRVKHHEEEPSKLQALLSNNRSVGGKWPEVDLLKLLRFVCGQCGLDFELETQLEEHLVNGHVELCIVQNLKMVIFTKSCAHCMICGMEIRYSTVRDLQFHYLRHMRYQPYKCKCHSYFFNDRYTAMLHLKNRKSENFNTKQTPLPAKKLISVAPAHILQQQSQKQHLQPPLQQQQRPDMYKNIKQSLSPTTSNPPVPQMLFMSNPQPLIPPPMGPVSLLEQELHDMCVKVEMKKAALKPKFSDLSANFDPNFTEATVGYRCSECGMDFPNERSWKCHGNEEHDLKTIEGLNMTRLPETGSICCNHCGIILNGKWDNYKLRRHRLTHSPFKSFYCRICNYERKRKDDIVVHIRQAHC